MTERNRQPDDVEQHVSERFRNDLQALHAPPGPVPQRVDRTILDEARRRLARPRRLVIPLRWAAAAAAAVIVLGTLLYTAVLRDSRDPTFRHPQSARRVGPPPAEDRADIDGNGRVDILDALRLAKRIESRGRIDTEWDLNGDGVVDRKDVDAVALAAVRLGPEPQVSRGEGASAFGSTAIPSAGSSRRVGCVPRTDFVWRVPSTAMEPERWCVIRTLPETCVTVEDALDEGV